MTTYFVSYVDGDDGAGDGLSWDTAWLSLKKGIETASAVAGGPHILKVDSDGSEQLGADTTITVAGNIWVFSVDRSAADALQATFVIGSQATNYGITLTGGHDIYLYGITFKNGTSTTAKDILIGRGDPSYSVFDTCRFELANNSSNDVFIGESGVGQNSFILLENCVFKFGNANCRLLTYSPLIEMVNCSVDSGGTAPTVLFAYTSASPHIFCIGCDWSYVTGTLLTGADASEVTCELVNCKLGAGVTLKGANTVTNKGGASITARNCNSGDAHYSFFHADCYGQTTVSTSVYVTADGASYDGTSKCSWQITTTANCTYYTPYTSPWIDVYHSGTSEISPYLEILRSGSTIKYQNDEVWSEWSYQGTSGSTKATIVNDRMTPLGTAADQTASSLGASDWTGEDATNNAYMKLESGSITPAEIGHIRARAVVGEPNITVYVDPYIRGLT